MKKFAVIIVALAMLCMAAGTAYADCRGCCSHHGGVCCIDDVTKCCDGTSLSPKCTAKGCNKCSSPARTITPVYSEEGPKKILFLKSGGAIECDETWIAGKDIVRCKKGRGMLLYSTDDVDLKKTFGESFVEFPTTTREEKYRVKDSFSQEHKKSSWYIGFGIGTGDGSAEVDGVKKTSTEWFNYAGLSASPVLTMNFGVGAIINPKLHLGFDLSAIRQEGSGHGVEYGVQVNNYLVALTYFPKVEGLFLKAGAGISSIVYNVAGGSASAYPGTAILGGVGYAFWLGKSFNLCLNAEYSHQTYSDKYAPDNSQFWNLYVSFYWF